MKKIDSTKKGDTPINDIDNVIKRLCKPQSYRPVFHRSNHEAPMPSVEILSDIMHSLRSVLFPGYFGNSDIKAETMQYHIGASIDRVFLMLSEQVRRGFCFFCSEGEDVECVECEKRGRDKANRFINTLPEIRRLLSTDVMAAYEGDPAAKHFSETIFCYPSIKALINFRVAHELHLLDVPLIPRIITEMAHSETGIDIHPGAKIGERFFMDHGTGIVIGETSVIGNNVRLYQGVTLGARSFTMDENGNPIKGIPRHPIVDDDVIIYSGATILGRIKIGREAVIGGNVWITHDVLPGTRVVQGKLEEFYYEQGTGI